MCFLFAGKLVAKKRLLDLLRACEIARRSDPSIRVLVVGTGEAGAEAMRFARERDLPAVFAGFLNQTQISRAYFAAAVCPAFRYGKRGAGGQRAMVHGLPAIVSDRVGCRPGPLEDGVTGRVFPCGDIGALAACWSITAANADRRREMGRRARHRVEAYSGERALEGTLEAVEFVIRERVEIGA